jgi:predicted RNA-binding Zn ribbon-like protein
MSMTAAVHLDPGPYRGTYKLIGGAPSLDFANLVSYRDTDRQHDWLEPEENIVEWQRAAGLGHAAAGDVAELLDLRELLARVFLAVADARTPGAADVAWIGTQSAAAQGRARLTLAPGNRQAVWHDDALRLTGTLALDAAELLTSPERLGRVRACGGCRWVFLDGTRNRSRRWCDPADCGNRARQRRHYAKHQGDPRS